MIREFKPAKIIKIHIIAAAAVFFMICAMGMIVYPERSISYQELFGPDNANLKDYEIGSTPNTLISTGDDSWVEFPYHGGNVYEIELGVEEVSISYSWAQIFLEDSWEYSTAFLKQGQNFFDYGFGKTDVSMIRFDLTAVTGVSVAVASVTVNPRRHMIVSIWQKYMALLIFVFVTEGLLWSFWKKRKQSGKRNIPAAMTMILQIIFEVMLIRSFFDSETALRWLYLMEGIAETLLIMLIMLPSGRRRSCQTARILLCSLMMFSVIELLSGTPYDGNAAAYFFCNIAVNCAVICLFYLLFRGGKPAWIIAEVLLLVLGLVNHYYFIFRSQAFEFADIQMAGTALNVISDYSFEVNALVVSTVLAVVTTLCAVLSEHREKEKTWFGKTFCFAGILMAVSLVIVIGSKAELSFWNTNETSQKLGYVYSFVKYMQETLDKPEPEGYSVQKAEEILNRYAGRDADADSRETLKADNIIVIMNEAFSDLPDTYQFDTDQDGMPFIHSLEGKNVSKGYILTSVFGGTTANTEYEFLTGNSMAFLNPGDVPYTEYIESAIPSLATVLKSHGYDALALHPFHASGYKRYKVYPLLGFDDFISVEDPLPYTDKIRDYISDLSDMQDVEYYDEQSGADRPFFIFNVTMQNHGGYDASMDGLQETIRPTDSSLRQYNELSEYLTLVHESDQAFESLVDYYSRSSERTIVLMFGDHQPGLSDEVYQAMDAAFSSIDISLEQMQKKYQVPYILWTNYDLEEKAPALTSPNYLRQFLLKNAGIPFSSFDELVYECAKTYPAINQFGFHDQNGDLHSADEIDQTDRLKEYKMCAYYQLFEHKRLDWEFFQ